LLIVLRLFLSRRHQIVRASRRQVVSRPRAIAANRLAMNP
jgi:hypothetical protein